MPVSGTVALMSISPVAEVPWLPGRSSVAPGQKLRGSRGRSFHGSLGRSFQQFTFLGKPHFGPCRRDRPGGWGQTAPPSLSQCPTGRLRPFPKDGELPENPFNADGAVLGPSPRTVNRRKASTVPEATSTEDGELPEGIEIQNNLHFNKKALPLMLAAIRGARYEDED